MKLLRTQATNFVAHLLCIPATALPIGIDVVPIRERLDFYSNRRLLCSYYDITYEGQNDLKYSYRYLINIYEIDIILCTEYMNRFPSPSGASFLLLPNGLKRLVDRTVFTVHLFCDDGLWKVLCAGTPYYLVDDNFPGREELLFF